MAKKKYTRVNMQLSGRGRRGRDVRAWD